MKIEASIVTDRKAFLKLIKDRMNILPIPGTRCTALLNIIFHKNLSTSLWVQTDQSQKCTKISKFSHLPNFMNIYAINSTDISVFTITSVVRTRF